MNFARRDALRSLLGVGVFALTGCGLTGCGRSSPSQGTPLAFDGSGLIPGTDLKEPVANSRFRRVLNFVEESPSRIGFKYGRGHDARRSLDVASLTEPATRITPTERHFLRSEFPDLLRPGIIREIPVTTSEITDHEADSLKISTEDLLRRSVPHDSVLMECAGNTGQQLGFGLMSVAEWAGVPLMEILQPLSMKSEDRILVSGFDARTSRSTHSSPGASWIFQQSELARSGAFLATQMNGKPLSPDHGAPVRLIVPYHYGCCQIKWVNEIRTVRDDVPATSQMIEFAVRTHQEIDMDRLSNGESIPASEFLPPEMHPSALPVRAELWDSGNGNVVRIVGISWGGIQPAQKLVIRVGSQSSEVPVTAFVPRLSGLPFGLWCHLWVPERKIDGQGLISMRFVDEGIRSARMDRGHYSRRIRLDADVFES